VLPSDPVIFFPVGPGGRREVFPFHPARTSGKGLIDCSGGGNRPFRELAGFLKLAKFDPADRRPGPAIEAAQSDLRDISAAFPGNADADATIKQVERLVVTTCSGSLDL